MICQRCLRHLSRRAIAFTDASFSQQRAFSLLNRHRSTPVTAQTTTATVSRPHDRPAATSTSAAQPFSTPLSPSPDRQNLPIQPRQSKQAARLPASSVPAGTVLKGLNFMKNKPDPVALEDHEYPPWLWSVLDKTGTEEGDGKAGSAESDLFCMSPNPPYTRGKT